MFMQRGVMGNQRSQRSWEVSTSIVGLVVMKRKIVNVILKIGTIREEPHVCECYPVNKFNLFIQGNVF